VKEGYTSNPGGGTWSRSGYVCATAKSSRKRGDFVMELVTRVGSCDLRVAGCELRVVGCELRVAGDKGIGHSGQRTEDG
jgi:hypothetical protein